MDYQPYFFIPTLFFHKYWNLFSDEVSKALLSFLNGEANLGDLNHTFTVLIPKVNLPEHITQYQSISLCNVLYKMISKALANELMLGLSYLTSDT